MFDTAFGILAIFAWTLLVAIFIVLGCAAVTEFAATSAVARRMGSLGRIVGARFYR
jgi:hypothetical protein